jgi:hypothetical protein
VATGAVAWGGNAERDVQAANTATARNSAENHFERFRLFMYLSPGMGFEAEIIAHGQD